MHYLLLIYGQESAAAQMSQEAAAQEIAAYNAFTEEAMKSGAMVSGNVLMPTNTATTVRVRDGKVLTTDGPFAETKEQISGYYVMKCNDLDEAITLAAKIPGAAYGSIEVRPVMEFPEG